MTGCRSRCCKRCDLPPNMGHPTYDLSTWCGFGLRPERDKGPQYNVMKDDMSFDVEIGEHESQRLPPSELCRPPLQPSAPAGMGLRPLPSPTRILAA